MITCSGCEYIVQVKANAPALYRSVALSTTLGSPPISSYYTYEEGRGRKEHRYVELHAHDIRDLISDDWKGISRLAKVSRWGHRKKEPYSNTGFYIISYPTDRADEVGRAIRRHWSIENNLHWIKDATMKEDDMPSKRADTATMIAHLNTLVLNLLRTAGFQPTKKTFSTFTHKVRKLMSLFDGTYQMT